MERVLSPTSCKTFHPQQLPNTCKSFLTPSSIPHLNPSVHNNGIDNTIKWETNYTNYLNTTTTTATSKSKTMPTSSTSIGLSLEQVLEESSTEYTYRSEGLIGTKIKPTFFKSYLHVSKKTSSSSPPSPPKNTTARATAASTTPTTKYLNTTSVTIMEPSSKKQHHQPRKAWEWHYRSFLSRSSNNNKNNKQKSRISRIFCINPRQAQHKPRTTVQADMDDLDKSDRSTSSSNSNSIRKKIRNKLFTKSQSTTDLTAGLDNYFPPPPVGSIPVIKTRCNSYGHFTNNTTGNNSKVDPLQVSLGKQRNRAKQQQLHSATSSIVATHNNNISQHSPPTIDNTAAVTEVVHPTIRKSFTTYHNSRDFGKDTTSAYLGTEDDAPSSHYNTQQFYNFYHKLSSYPSHSHRTSSYSPSYLYASSEPLDTLVECSHNHYDDTSPDSVAVDINNNIVDAGGDHMRIPLFPLQGIESWKNNNEEHSDKWILPAVLRICPVSVVTLLLSENDVQKNRKNTTSSSSRNSNARSGLAQMFEPEPEPEPVDDANANITQDDDNQQQTLPTQSPLFSSIQKNKLGNAKVTIKQSVHKNMNLEDNHHHFQSTFYIAMNYLYEYNNVNNTNNKKQTTQSTLLPRSIAHLQNAIIQKHANFTNALEIVLVQNSQKKKHLVIRVKNMEERDDWVDKLRIASSLSIEDIYDFDLENDVLGIGRYATIVSATPKQILQNPKQSPFTPNTTTKSAIKIIDKPSFFERVSRSKERIDTLVREVAIQTTLSIQEGNNNTSNSNTFLQLKNVFETSTKLVLELELLNGMDLFTYITSKTQNGEGLNENKAAWIIRDLLVCCSKMKRRGIAHRDIKPANILISDDLLSIDQHSQNKQGSSVVSVKLGDYGMSTFCGIDDLCHGRCGTPGYVSPEILKAGASCRYRNLVDVFSVGVTLYVLLCGYEPFYGENDSELIQVNKEGLFDFPDDDWSTVSEEAKDLIVQMMEKDPLKRITADMALKHPWITKYAPPLDNTSSTTTANGKLSTHYQHTNNNLNHTTNTCAIS